MKNKKYLYIIFSIVGVLAITFVFVVGDVVAASSVTLPTGTGLSNNSVDGILDDVVNFVAGAIAALAILMIVVSGIMYMTAAGDEKRTEIAKTMLVYSVVGLVVALLGFVIVESIGGMLGAG